MELYDLRLTLTCFLLFGGILLEVFSLRTQDVASNDPSKIYTDAVHRERLHGASIVLILTAFVVCTVLSS